MIQIANTTIYRLLLVTTFEYCIAYLIARSLSKVTNIRWRYEADESVVITQTQTFSSISLLLRPNNRNILHKTYNGWPKRPVNASVTAKQASKMLLLVRSRGLFLMTKITRTLSRTVKGQTMLLMLILIM